MTWSIPPRKNGMATSSRITSLCAVNVPRVNCKTISMATNRPAASPGIQSSGFLARSRIAFPNAVPDHRSPHPGHGHDLPHLQVEERGGVRRADHVTVLAPLAVPPTAMTSRQFYGSLVGRDQHAFHRHLQADRNDPAERLGDGLGSRSPADFPGTGERSLQAGERMGPGHDSNALFPERISL